ncbi:hypothetical protein [Gryllotalpicola protaetiae]|uniref:FtsX-like permease family protein n=1 Tax=Gryllotalpicola protaetiae TaxID=2419771 RepID=A0A387BV30_9MICO|nr:hypothetical protein [Gryllotalpicola protaetiae]AYG02271.1 hypothetical protein D7I44_01140 [Gryllotalpicola protaetiae]
MIAARRVRAHSALFAALACVCALLAGLGVGLVGHLDSAALDGVRSGIGGLSGAQAELRFDAPKADDTAKQSARAEAIIARELRHGRSSVPVTVTRTTPADDDDFIWTVRADASRIAPADLPVLARAGSRIHSAMLDDDAVGAQGVEKSGSLDSQAKALAARVAPLAGIQPVPLLLVAAIGLVTLAELARLLDGVRLRETALLRSRGASAARVGRTTAVEALVVAGLGAVIGAGAATELLLVFGEHPLGWSLLGAIVLAVVAAAVALVAGVAYNSARLAFRRDTVDDSGRVRRLAAPGLVVLLVAAAGLSLWRYLQFGSPLSPTSTGAAVDPIAVLAPALCLAAVAVLCLAVFPPVARGLESAGARGDGARLALVAGQLARRARMIASPIVLIALAGGGLVVAACYTPTWQAAAEHTAAMRAGSDLVVTGTTDSSAIGAAHGVRAAAPAVEFTWQTDSGVDASLAALGQSGLRHAVSPAGGAVDRTALAAATRTPLAGSPIPAGATELYFSITASGVTPTLAAFVVDADGIGTRLPLTAQGTEVAQTALPRGSGRRLVALEVSVPAAYPAFVPIPGHPESGHLEPVEVAFHVGSVVAADADGAAHPLALGGAWKPVGSESAGGYTGPYSPDGTLGLTGMGGQATVLRFVPPQAQAVPVVISRAFATASHANAGTKLSFDLSGGAGGDLDATVASVRPELPGARGEYSVVADFAALQTQRIIAGTDPLPASSVWVRTDAPRGAAAAVAHALPGARITGPAIDPGNRVLTAVPVALWLGMTGGAALALIALAAVAGELLRLRSEEVGVLRALGFAPRTLARLRRWELVAACLAAALGAAASGAITSALVVPGLARVAIENPFTGLRQPLHVDLVGLGVAALAIAVVIAGIVTVYGARVAQQARTVVAREGAR